MSGNMYRYLKTPSIPAYDTASQYSATYSDVSVEVSNRNPDIGQRLYTLFREQLYTDVKFVLSCGVKPKPTLSAHKAILAIGSSKFKEMFYGNSNQPECKEIQINNVPYEAFKSVIEYLYTDDVVFEDDKIVLDILSAATVFQVQGLVSKCESFIESIELSEDNVCSKFQLAISKSLNSLKSKCIEFIQENTGAVLCSNDFLSVNPSTLKSICKLEKFNLHSEIDLLYAIVRYVENRPEYIKNHRAGIDSFLKHIRIMNVTCVEFNHFVQSKPKVFTAPEAANILVALTNPANPTTSLPSWCKKGPNRCNYHLLSTPGRGERVYNSNVLRKLPLQLRPNKSKVNLSDLVCLLELKCLRGNHQVEGLKLSFDDPVDETSVIGHLIISVDVQPSRYHFEEHIQIENSKNVEFKFSRLVLARRDNTIIIRAVAREVKNYRFLQFEEENSFPPNAPFSCSLGSVPKQNKLFIISEILYRDAPSNPRRGPPNRRPRR